MPSTTSNSVSRLLASSTVMTPSLPTFFIASARNRPISAVAVGRDGADLGDLLVRGNLLGVLLELFDGSLDREVDAALQVHRVHAGGNRLGALLDDRLGENGGGGGAVTGEVRGLRGDFAHHLRAHVLKLVFELRHRRMT